MYVDYCSNFVFSSFYRCTTVYLTDRRIDMLPLLLSSNLCSLRGGVERFAFSCVWEIKPDTADIVTTKFCKSIIKSKLAMVNLFCMFTYTWPIVASTCSILSDL